MVVAVHTPHENAVYRDYDRVMLLQSVSKRLLLILLLLMFRMLSLGRIRIASSINCTWRLLITTA